MYHYRKAGKAILDALCKKDKVSHQRRQGVGEEDGMLNLCICKHSLIRYQETKRFNGSIRVS